MSTQSTASIATAPKRSAVDADRAKVPSARRAVSGAAVDRGWSPGAAPEPAGTSPTLHAFGRIPIHEPSAGQPQLTIGKPDDRYEAEAERAADAVLAKHPIAESSSSAAIQATTRGNTFSATPARVQTRAAPGTTPQVTPELPRQMQRAGAEGRSLPGEQRAFFEQRLGHDFSAVRIHAGPAASEAAASVKAQAFTHGQDIYFGQNYYRPEQAEGQRLMAHELVHTVQQRPNVIARRALEDSSASDGPDFAGAPARDADDGAGQPPGAVADQLQSTLEDDRSDTSGNVRGRLSQLSPSSRRQATAALQGRLASDQSQGEGRNVAVFGPARSPARSDAKAPPAEAGKREGDRPREARPGTPQARAAQAGAAGARSPSLASGATPTPAAAPAPPPSVATPAVPQTESKPAPSKRGETSGPPDAARTPPHARSSLEGPAHAGTPGGGGSSNAVDTSGDDDRPLRLADLFEQRPEARTSQGETGADDAGKRNGSPRAAPSATSNEQAPSGTAAAALLASERPAAGGAEAAAKGPAAEGSSAARMESLASDLETALAEANQELKARSIAVSAHVRQQAATARAGVRAEVVQAIKGIQAGQAGLLSELSTKVTATHSLIDTSLAARKSQAIAAGLTSQKAVRGIFSGHRDSVDDTVKKKTKDAETLRDKKGEVVRQRNQADIKTAYRMGGAKMRQYPGTMRGAYIGSAAFDVAEATAVKMREQESEIVNAIKENTEPLPQYFRAQGVQALQGFDVNLPKILASADSGVVKTHADQDKRAGEAHAQLDTVASQTRSEISSIGLEAVAQAAAFGPQVEGRLNTELSRVLKTIADAPGDVMRRISPPIEEAITLFRTGDKPDVDAAEALAGGLKGFIGNSIASAADAMEHAAAASGERFQGIHGSARQAMHAQLARTNKVWDGSRAGITKTTGTLHSNFDGAVAGSVSILQETLTGTENNIRDQLSPIVSQIGASFDDTLRDAAGKIDTRIDEGLGKNAEALTDLGGQMNEAARQAAFEYDHPVLSSIETGLEFLAGIIAGIITILAVVAIFLLIGWVIATVLGVSMLAAGLIMLAGMAGFAIGYAFAARLDAGQGVGEAFLGAVGDFGRSVPGMLYDMTGIPKLRKAFSDEPMTPYQRGKLIGEGGTELVLAIFMVRGAAKGIATGFRSLRFRAPVAAPEIAAAPELAVPRAPPAATAPVTEPRIGFGREPVPQPPGAPVQPEPRIGFGREPQPQPPGAPPQPEPRIGFGREGVRAAEPRPPGAPPQAEPRIGFGREGVRAAEPRPPVSQGPAGPGPDAPLDLRGKVVEGGRPGGSQAAGGGEPIRAGGRSSVEPRASAEPGGGGPKPAQPMQGKLETTPIEEPPAVEQPAAEQPALERPAEQAPIDEPAPKQPEAAKPKTPAKEVEPTQKQTEKPAEAPKQPEEKVSGKEEAPDESPKKDPELEQKHSDLKQEVEDLKGKRDAAVSREKRLKAQLEKADLEATKAQKELGIQKARGNFKGTKAAQGQLDTANAKRADLRGKISEASADARDWERLHANKARELELLDLRLNPQERSALPCFSADTVVWGATGPKPICTLVPGDMVRALDLASKTVRLRPVDAVFVNRTVHFYDIRLDGEVIRATARHRFWLSDECEWIEAKELKVGARLLHWDGLCKEVEEIVYYDVPVTPTYNLRVEELSNYFVGPGVLVHNDGAAPYQFGGRIIYEGTNPEFPGKIYVGQTDDIERREGEHQEEAAKELERTDLTKEQRDFWEFKKGMKLRERITGLNEDQANYMEQKNIDIELKLNKKNLMNRKLVEVSKERMAELELKISKDPIVKEAGFCAK